MSPLFYSKYLKKKHSKKLKKRYVMLPSRSVLMLLILKICKKKIDFKQVSKNIFIPVTSKKQNLDDFSKLYLRFL